ncbi:hypothetical protein K0M31_004912 [Melipona bicolor]|uniref:Uncharacterized protein n=1 Tax=Melipona bicolor TaxID=60889 RepID=A0AA40KN60_9HYME|nr:hypothetical protein K0M31_004912 [Melipona bicolor]
MALRTTRRRTRAALGTDAEETDAAVDVKLEEKNHIVGVNWDRFPSESSEKKKKEGERSLHNRDDFTKAQNDAVHLRDEDTGNGDEQRRSIHVNVAADRQDKSGDSRIDPELVRHQAKGDRECGSPVQNCVRKDRAGAEVD